MSDETTTAAELAANAEPPPAPDGQAPEAEALAQQIEKLQTQSAEYLDGWQRARAEFANYKRRVEKEQAEAHQSATARVVARFLDVVDDFDRAVQDRPGEGADAEALAGWVAGMDLIYRKLQAILDAFGVEHIQAEGLAFDPQFHEAVTHEESPEHAPGDIIGVVRQGYRLGDRVIRPALVRVAK